MIPFIPALNENWVIAESLRGIEQRIRAENKGVFSEAVILFDHVPVHRTQPYSGYDGYEVSGKDLHFALTDPPSGARNARRPYYVSNKEANVSLADSEVVSLEKARRWMVDWKAGKALLREQILQKHQSWRKSNEAAAADMRAREYERVRSDLDPLPPQVWSLEQEHAWQAYTDRGEAAAQQELQAWDGYPHSVTVLLVGNIGPCDGCKARLKVFLYELSGELFPKAFVGMKAVYTGDQCKGGVRGATDRLETEYGYPDRVEQRDIPLDPTTLRRTWVRSVTPWPVQQ
ncbi:hypothetical protein [Streptosporangium sp. NPDC048865]|uniref:hypothetical protein n=1 Tax=Streptosporangium sp. NPDC048865 TaxID=3155766 RepID=UPI0034136974